MKRHLLLLTLALASCMTLQAQWVDDPATNTFIANCPHTADEIYVSTDEASGDTYVQWTFEDSYSWTPTLQRLNRDGVPQWGEGGVRPNVYGHALSYGMAMVATNDNAVVTCFPAWNGQLEDHSIAMKINADGSYAWGEEGVTLFNGDGGYRTEVMAGNDGGVWALTTDSDSTFLCYIEANGTTNPTITISDHNGKDCIYGLMVPGPDNSVFVVYEKDALVYLYDHEKSIHVVGYTKDGTQITPDTCLMAPQTFHRSHIHYVVPDGLGGGYVYIWHGGMGGINTYVFHFDANGISTISDPNGIAVHTPDPDNYYLNAYATVDPISHDLLIAYIQTDAETEWESRIYINRITAEGEKVWGDGKLAASYEDNKCSHVGIDAFEDGSGFSLIFHRGIDMVGVSSTIAAIGFDMDGNELWNTTMSSSVYPRTAAENTSGFHHGQNIVAWIDRNGGIVYGQNISTDGTLGNTQPISCLAPENFEGEAVYDDETQTYGAKLTWTSPETQPLHYNLYVTDSSGCTTTIEIEPTETSYYDQMTIIGEVIYRLTAVYEDCESDYALTPDGEDHVYIEITDIPENTEEEIVSILSVYTIKGQLVNAKDLNKLSQGVYIVKGITDSGKTIIKKVIK